MGYAANMIRLVHPRLLLALLPIAFAACSSPASAGVPATSGISLTWSDCPGGATASSSMTYACSGDADTVRLVCSLAVPATLSGVIGAEIVVDMQSVDALVPDWWRMDGSGTGGCRAGMLDTAFDTLATPACADVWRGNAVGGNQGFSIGPPAHPLSSQARILEVASVPSANAVTLAPGTIYGLLTLVINSVHTVGPPACAGCAHGACLVFNSVLIRRLPGLGDQVFSAPAALESNWATWQGTAANCSAVPVRQTTWGAIKSLYR